MKFLIPIIGLTLFATYLMRESCNDENCTYNNQTLNSRNSTVQKQIFKNSNENWKIVSFIGAAIFFMVAIGLVTFGRLLKAR